MSTQACKSRQAARQSLPVTLLTRAIMAKVAESAIAVVLMPAWASLRAMAWPPYLGAPSATTTCKALRRSQAAHLVCSLSGHFCYWRHGARRDLTAVTSACTGHLGAVKSWQQWQVGSSECLPAVASWQQQGLPAIHVCQQQRPSSNGGLLAVEGWQQQQADNSRDTAMHKSGSSKGLPAIETRQQ